MAKRTTSIGTGLTKSILRQLRRTGLSVGTIAARYGTTRMTIYRRFNDSVKATTKARRRK